MASERKKIGILFSYSEGWIGGTYYFMNLVYSLLHLKDEERPHVVILSNDEDSYKKMQETGYPHLSFLPSTFTYSLPERIVNKIGRVLLGRNIIEKGYSEKELPVLFGYYEQLPFFRCKRKLFWIPDLQDKYYPHYLGKEIALEREKLHRKLGYSTAEVVFSSQAAKKDFESFYPSPTCTTYVLPFAVTLPDLSRVNQKEVAMKYGIYSSYFFSPNQFWSHKNHMTVIKAVEKLKKQGSEVLVVFTGNESTGGGAYARELKAYVAEQELLNNCLFLGFIDRKEQLSLMNGSIAVIQPSLFEGWSTVVEDAKCLGKELILSDLPVHHEQVDEAVSFFPAEDAQALSKEIMRKIQKGREERALDYESHVLRFAHSFLEAIDGQ